MAREASIERNTKETQIRLKLNIDGTGRSDINTGLLTNLDYTTLQVTEFLM